MTSARCGCGYETKAGFRAIRRPARPEDPQITAEPEGPAGQVETNRWRSELDKKFESSRESVEEIEDFQNRVDQLFTRRERPTPVIQDKWDIATRAESEMDRAIEDLDDAAGEPAISASEVPLPVELKESIIDASVRPGPARQAEQKTLTLQPLAPDLLRQKAAPAEERETGRALPREIIFSRILAGIVDVLLPVLLAVLFVFAAAWFLRFDFFSPASTRAWAALALLLYFLSSLYFFWTAGQTLGMQLTELKLVSQEDEEPAWNSVLVRVVLFLPILFTLVGLVLALFDPECRALHDRLSKTKVVPVKAP